MKSPPLEPSFSKQGERRKNEGPGPSPPGPDWPDRAAQPATQGPALNSQELVTEVEAACAAGIFQHCWLVPLPGTMLATETQMSLKQCGGSSDALVVIKGAVATM